MLARFDLRAALPRLPGLVVGLILFGVGIAVMKEAGLGLGPWESLHDGLGLLTGQPLGTISIALGIPILLLWWPLGERPGIGTLLNVITIGSATNLGLAVLPTVNGPVAVELAVMLVGLLTIAVGSGLYLAADLGPGPRDGLMTGVHRRFGWSIRRARTAIEVTVLIGAFLLGGAIGLGTVVFALGIGPLVQVTLGWFDRDGRVQRRRGAELEEELEALGTVGE